MTEDDQSGSKEEEEMNVDTEETDFLQCEEMTYRC